MEEESQKFLTTHDLGRGIIYTRAAEIIVNTNYIRSEREAPIDVFNQIVFGSVSDNARTIKYYRSNFLQNNNDFQTKLLFDWSLSTITSGYSLIIGIVNGLFIGIVNGLFLNPEDFFYMMDNWCKNLGRFLISSSNSMAIIFHFWNQISSTLRGQRSWTTLKILLKTMSVSSL